MNRSHLTFCFLIALYCHFMTPYLNKKTRGLARWKAVTIQILIIFASGCLLGYLWDCLVSLWAK